MKKAQRGAPKKPPAKRKSNVVQIRLTDAEKAACEAAAAKSGRKMSAWARATLVEATGRKAKSS